MKINCSDYSIYINDWSALQDLVTAGDYSQVLVIVDENTRYHCLPRLTDALEQEVYIIEVASGEEQKTIETCQFLWKEMIEAGADRHSLCINLGGGVIGDMGGFAAATFMRGMDFIQIPTTLLSQVDASVGGKLGVDHQSYKNIIGLIKNPQAVFVFTSYLTTLPYLEVRSGYAELIKHGLIADAEAYKQLLTITDLSIVNWAPLVTQSVQLKQGITDADPTEKGLRKILNFGHTLGHAIESHCLGTEYYLLHGEAVAIGMVMEAHLSYQLSYITEIECSSIKSYIIGIYGQVKDGLPTIDELIPTMLVDKKNRGGKIMFSLLSSIGTGNYNQEVTTEQIERAIAYYMA